ncbi:MAG: hypothetical protein EHM35_06840, partial [Planctomycetaceae bacterium]
MRVRFHPHARDRLAERGTSQEEVVLTVETGERFSARFGRFGFRRNVQFGEFWRGKQYSWKQIEAYAIRRYDGWMVISVVTR